MVFSHNTNLNGSIKLNLENKLVKRSTNVKILALTFDQRLTWKPDVRQLKTECQKLLNIVKTLSLKHWDARKEIVIPAFKALIRFKLDYGAIVYNSALNIILKTLYSIHIAGL